MSFKPYWKPSDASLVCMEVKGQFKTFNVTLPDYLAAIRFPNAIHNCIQFCLENNITYQSITTKKVEDILFPEKKNDVNTKNMILFIDARDRIRERIYNNQIIPFHEPWLLRQLPPDQRYEFGYIGLKNGKNLQYILPTRITNKAPTTREDNEWTKIHNDKYIYSVVKRAINQTYWNDGDENKIKMNINFTTKKVSLTFPQIIVASENPEIYFEYLHDIATGKKNVSTSFFAESFTYSYLIEDKCKIFPKGKISYFRPIVCLDDFDTLKFADRIKFLSIDAYSKWLNGEPVPEYKDDIEREKKIKEREFLKQMIEYDAYLNLTQRTKFYEKVLENKDNFTTKTTDFQIGQSMYYLAYDIYPGDPNYNQKKEHLLSLMKTAFEDPALNEMMLNSYNEYIAKLQHNIATTKSTSIKNESLAAIKNLRNVGKILGIEKDSDDQKSKCCYLI